MIADLSRWIRELQTKFLSGSPTGGQAPQVDRQASEAGAAGVYSRRGILCTIKQLAQKDDRLPRVGIADEPRNALKMAVLQHRHTARGAEGRVIVLYSPFVKPPLVGPHLRRPTARIQSCDRSLRERTCSETQSDACSEFSA